MKYACHDCDKNGVYTELSSNIHQRFIAKDGRCLCEKCSVGVNQITERQRIIIDYIQHM